MLSSLLKSGPGNWVIISSVEVSHKNSPKKISLDCHIFSYIVIWSSIGCRLRATLPVCYGSPTLQLTPGNNTPYLRAMFLKYITILIWITNTTIDTGEQNPIFVQYFLNLLPSSSSPKAIFLTKFLYFTI